MAGGGVVFSGLKEFSAGLAAMHARQVAATRIGGNKASNILKKEIQRMLSATGAPGEPSAPGEPPHLQTGDLRRSIQADGPQELAGTSMAWDVGPTVIYGRIQDLGGRAGHSTLPARPYMARSLLRAQPMMYQACKEAWAAALRRG